LAVEGLVAEFGPWVEAAVALADFDDSAFVFPARGDGIQWVFGAQRVTMDEDRFVKVQHGKSGVGARGGGWIWRVGRRLFPVAICERTEGEEECE